MARPPQAGYRNGRASIERLAPKAEYRSERPALQWRTVMYAVVGATGNSGRAVVKELVALGEKPVSVVRNADKAREVLEASITLEGEAPPSAGLRRTGPAEPRSVRGAAAHREVRPPIG